MYIFRWLMTHPILTTWMLTAIVILLTIGGGHNKEEPQHSKVDESNGKESTVATDMSPQDGAVAQHAQDTQAAHQNPVVDAQVATGEVLHAAENKATDAVQAVAATADEAVKAGENAVNSAAEAVQEAASSASDTMKHATEAVTASVDNPTVSADAGASTSTAGNTGQAEAQAPVVEASANADTNAVAEQPGAGGSEPAPANVDLNSLSAAELLVMAREAFWSDEKEKSAGIYKMLIERDPSSLLYKGELGNVYWHQNRQKESAELYADIAIPMLKAGKTREVSNMLGFIGAFYPEKARAIHQMMTGN